MRNVSQVVILWAALSATAGARDVYVSNVAGDDRLKGSLPTAQGSDEGPCRSIGRALREAQAGDRIIVANTGIPYREALTVQAKRHSGTPEHPFQIIGNGATLDGSALVPEGTWRPVKGDLFRFAPPLKSYQQLFLSGKPAQRVPLDDSELRLPVLKPLEWCFFQRQIYFRVEKDRLPEQYELTYAAIPVGISLYEVRNVVIRDLVVQGFQLDGINARDGVFETTLRGVTCRGNARSGIAVAGASQVTLEECLLGNNGAAQLRAEGKSHTHVVNCDLLDNTAPAVVRDGGRVYLDQAEPASKPENAEPQPAAKPAAVSALPARPGNSPR